MKKILELLMNFLVLVKRILNGKSDFHKGPVSEICPSDKRKYKKTSLAKIE